MTNEERRIARRQAIAEMRATGKYTLAEIGERFGITRERVRQICRAEGVPAMVAWSAPRYRRVEWQCEQCGKQEERVPSLARRRFCSLQCAGKSKRVYPPGTPFRYTGPGRNHGRLMIRNQYAGSTITYERYLAQEMLGRKLRTDEWVTLIDKGRDPSPDEMDNIFIGTPKEVMALRGTSDVHWRKAA